MKKWLCFVALASFVMASCSNNKYQDESSLTLNSSNEVKRTKSIDDGTMLVFESVENFEFVDF